MIVWLRNLTYAVLVLLILALLLILVLPVYFQQRAAVVLSPSMEPALPMGALVFAIPIEPEEVRMGDIITFSREEDPDIVSSHRVVEVVSTNGELSFRTKGDANENIDPYPIAADYVIGKVVFHIPRLGRLLGSALSYIRNWPALVLLVAVPSLIIVGSTVYGIYRPPSRRRKRLALLRKRQRRRKR